MSRAAPPTTPLRSRFYLPPSPRECHFFTIYADRPSPILLRTPRRWSCLDLDFDLHRFVCACACVCCSTFNPWLDRVVPLALALLNISHPDMPVIDQLSRLTHDADADVAQSAIMVRSERDLFFPCATAPRYCTGKRWCLPFFFLRRLFLLYFFVSGHPRKVSARQPACQPRPCPLCSSGLLFRHALPLEPCCSPFPSASPSLHIRHDRRDPHTHQTQQALGLVSAGTNNSRVAQLLRQLSEFYAREASHLFVTRIAQGLNHMGKVGLSCLRLCALVCARACVSVGVCVLSILTSLPRWFGAEP